MRLDFHLYLLRGFNIFRLKLISMFLKMFFLSFFPLAKFWLSTEADPNAFVIRVADPVVIDPDLDLDSTFQKKTGSGTEKKSQIHFHSNFDLKKFTLNLFPSI